MHTGVWWRNLKERQLERPRRKLDDNIKMDPQEVGLGSIDWINLA
jgi:hypothetical protein